jgi:hypothetical protein
VPFTGSYQEWDGVIRTLEGPPCEPLQGASCGYLRFPVLAAERSHREDLVMATRSAASLAETLLTLPTHPRVSARDLESIG